MGDPGIGEQWSKNNWEVWLGKLFYNTSDNLIRLYLKIIIRVGLKMMRQIALDYLCRCLAHGGAKVSTFIVLPT